MLVNRYEQKGILISYEWKIGNALINENEMR